VPLGAAPFWRRSWTHRAAQGLLGIVYCYAVVVIVALCLENRLLYQGLRAGEHWYAPPGNVVPSDVSLTSADGTHLHGWWSETPGWTPKQGALLFLHGNGANLSDRGACLGAVNRILKLPALIIDYPGYGKSDGSPSERGCYAAGEAAFAWLTDSRQVAPERIVLFGGSLGGGVATELATRHPHRALVLVSTFTSFPDEAQDVVPWLPGKWLVRNQYNNLAKLPSIRGPVFVANGTRDDLIDYHMSEKLYHAAVGPKKYCPMEGEPHGDFMPDDALHTLRAFLDSACPISGE
jgi:fermentation-respiration switch protein FrsA (DUF1100 family)